ncbi:unnamed protein product [Polarella glacialis]|uniref:Uncharacterized protein n=1 Tax=Polarella glacialis TaxID=89957 RepID=A0A813I0N5_POLGL|nr:unnamed protein product [Polarella glacialis]
MALAALAFTCLAVVGSAQADVNSSTTTGPEHTATTTYLPTGPGTTVTGAPPTTTTALTEDTPNATSRTKVDIMGQSGKFTVYDERSGKGSGIQLTMDALREVDADGTSVGASGSVKHSINTFAAQDFSIADAEDVTLGNRQVPALKISFSSSISTIGKIRVDTYVIGKSGLLGPPGEWAVLPGDLKWSIELSEWNWCGCSKGQTTEEGAFVDLDISVKGLGTAQANTGSNKSLSLGGGVNLELSSQTYTDGAWVSMPEGYPKIVMQGSSTIFTFRFPKFSTSSLYDPVLTGLNAAAESSDSSTTTGPGTTSAGPGATSAGPGATSAGPGATSEGPGVTSEGGGTITTSLPATSAAPPTVITGDFSFTVDNCTSFIGQNKAGGAISSGLATTLGVSSDYIQTALGCTARRLASAVVPARHLSEAVKATYTITMPSSDSVGTGSAISSVQSKMKVGMEAVLTQAIQSALTDAGVTGAITVTAIAEPTITGASPTTTTALTEDTPNATSRTKVDIMGQSGKFTVYDERSGKGSGIQLTMDALREVDADGTSVGASGSVKHSINTFAAQDFSIADAEDVTFGNSQVPALKISFSSSISTIGNIRVDTYVIGKSGLVGPPGEEWAVLPGDLKWSIELSEWNWCGCSKGQTTEEGAFVDLDISVKGLGTAQANAGSNKSLSLGGGVNLELSSQTYTDGAWVSMPEGYPKIVMQGSSTIFTFRFPKFSTSSLYDPVLTGLSAAAESSDSSTTADLYSSAQKGARMLLAAVVAMAMTALA